MRQQRPWRVRRSGVAAATGQQRWDRAYQLLLQWATTNPADPATPPALASLLEVPRARSDLWPYLDQPPG